MYPEHLQKYIPPDFDLDKYEQSAKMSLEDWLINLTARYITYQASQSQFKGEYNAKEQSALEQVNTDCIQIYGVVFLMMILPNMRQ